MAEKRDRHARFLVRVWDDEAWKSLSPRGQWFYMLLSSQASLNHAGIVDLTTKRWSRLARGSSIEQVLLAIKELEQDDFIVADHDTEELFLRSHMRDDGVAKQPNVLKAALRQAREVHSGVIRLALAEELRQLGKPDADEVADSLVKANRNPSPKGPVKGSGPSEDSSVRNGRSRAVQEPLSEGFPEPIVQPRGVGEGVSSSSLVSTSLVSTSTSATADEPRPDVEELCVRLRDRIVANGSKATITAKWRDDARRLLDRDKRPHDEALELIDWCQADSFWQGNVLSMPTFRKQYDRLRLQSQRTHLRAVSGGYEPFRSPVDQSVYDEEL